MPTGIEEGVTLAAVLGLAANISDLVQAAGVLVDWAKAQEGLKYNLYTFSFDNSQVDKSKKPENPSATLAKPDDSKKPASMAKTAWANPQIPHEIQFLELLATGTVNVDSKAMFKIILMTIGAKSVGVVLLNALQGFDTALGDQAEVDFYGHEVDGGHLITFKGFVNKFGPGFGHFSGSVLLDYSTRSTRYMMAQIVPEMAGVVSLPGNGLIRFKF